MPKLEDLVDRIFGRRDYHFTVTSQSAAKEIEKVFSGLKPSNTLQGFDLNTQMQAAIGLYPILVKVYPGRTFDQTVPAARVVAHLKRDATPDEYNYSIYFVNSSALKEIQRHLMRVQADRREGLEFLWKASGAKWPLLAGDHLVFVYVGLEPIRGTVRRG